LTAAEIQQAVLDGYSYWMDVLEQADAETALTVVDGFLALADSQGVERHVRADVWLKAAGIHYRERRLAKALVAAGHAVLTRPVVAGRPIKRAFTRLAAALKS
jgi:hypothetical protein